MGTERAEGAHRRDGRGGLPEPPAHRRRSAGAARFPRDLPPRLRRGLRVTVFTNGTMVTDRIADLFDRYRPAGRRDHALRHDARDLRARDPGAGLVRPCLAGIDRLLARGIPLKLKTMALTWNVHEIPAMREFARELGLRVPARQHPEPARGLRGQPQRRAAARPGAGGGARPRRPRAGAALKEACDDALARRPTAGPATSTSTPAGRPEHLHGRSLRLPPALPALAPQRLRPQGAALRPRAGTSTSRSCARASGSRTPSAAAAA